MKRILSLTLGLLAAIPALAAETNATDQIKAAVAKLKAEANYSWTVKVELPTMGFTPEPMQGQTEKGGFTLVTQPFNDNVLQAAFKGTNVVLKLEDAWTSATDSPMGWWLAFTKTAADEAADFVGRAKALTAGENGLLSSDLTEDGAKESLSFGRRGAGGGPPPPKNAKGSVKFWLKDGALTKFESRVKGTVAFGPDQDEQDMEMIRTVEVHDLGKTKIEVPAEAKKQLEAK